MKKTWLLTLVSILTICCVLCFGYNRTWFIDKPVLYWQAFVRESAAHASREDVRRARYGAAYAFCMTIKDSVEKGHIKKDALLLFEPNGYYKDSLHTDLHMPEPALLYYYTGLRGLWINSPGVGNANYLVRIREGKVTLEPILSDGQLKRILDGYRKFTPML